MSNINQWHINQWTERFGLGGLIYMPRKLLINPSKLIPRRGNEPLQRYFNPVVCAYSVLIDKDNTPRWSPDKLHEVTAEVVQSYFEPFPQQSMELQLDDWILHQQHMCTHMHTDINTHHIRIIVNAICVYVMHTDSIRSFVCPYIVRATAEVLHVVYTFNWL